MLKQISSIKEFGGYLNRYEHASSRCHCDMVFSIFLPAQATLGKIPVLYWLSGLTCSDENARTKAGMQRYAAEQGIAVVFPDTSPRGKAVADDSARYDLGQGAGFYLNASQSPWQQHYHMYDYISQELPALVASCFPILADRKSISGHSMGGHGALICALKNPGSYRSVSAFAPICNPIACDWGQRCFNAYLGSDVAAWPAFDATALIRAGAHVDDILIDQGTDDQFYTEGQLLPANFQSACTQVGQALTLRMQPGYDHSYHFIATFVAEHIAYHAAALKA